MGPVWQVVPQDFPVVVSAEGGHHYYQGIGQYFREQLSLGIYGVEGQLFDWGTELGVYAGLVASGVCTIPAEIWQMDGVQAVQRVGDALS